MLTRTNVEPPIKIGGRWRPAGKGPHDDVEIRVAYSFIHLPNAVFLLDGVSLTDFSLMKREDGWLVMLKGTRRGVKKIAWLHAKTWKEAVTLAATATDSQHTPWADPKPPKRPAGWRRR